MGGCAGPAILVRTVVQLSSPGIAGFSVVVRGLAERRAHEQRGVAGMLQDAIDRNDPVREFTLLTHGTEDEMELPSGFTFSAGPAFRIHVIDSAGNPVRDMTQLFQNALAPNADVYLIGCNVAAGEQNMARRMSQILPGRRIHGHSYVGLYLGFYSPGVGIMKTYINGVEQ